MLELRDVTVDNWYACYELKVAETQQTFARPAALTLLQANYYPTLRAQAVYAREEVVGVVLYVDQPDQEYPGDYWFKRLMIDEQHQGKGYGRKAAEEVVRRLSAKPDCKRIFLSHAPGNINAENLYKSLGFAHTGEETGGQLVMCLVVRD